MIEYNQFVFSQLFMLLLSEHVSHLTYDQIHPVLSDVWDHWVLTDALYGRPDHEAEYDAMERYIKTNADNIRVLLDEVC